MRLQPVGENIWICDGDVVNFVGLPYSTRMTAIRLRDGALWVHSPVKLDEGLQGELERLGEIKYLVSPNKLHHLYLRDWMNEYPEAKCYAPPGLIQKRKDIRFTRELGDLPEPEWEKEIKQTIFKGSPAMEEAVLNDCIGEKAHVAL